MVANIKVWNLEVIFDVISVVINSAYDSFLFPKENVHYPAIKLGTVSIDKRGKPIFDLFPARAVATRKAAKAPVTTGGKQDQKAEEIKQLKVSILLSISSVLSVPPRAGRALSAFLGANRNLRVLTAILVQHKMKTQRKKY